MPLITFLSSNKVCKTNWFSLAILSLSNSAVKLLGEKGVSTCLSLIKRFNLSSVLPLVVLSIPSGLKNFKIHKQVIWFLDL